MASQDRKWHVRVANMRWIKGVVIMTANKAVLIELENGKKEWATPHFKLNIREQVLIAWDYTNDCIGTITTKERWENTETEQDKVEASSMIDVFQSPSDEPFEGDLNDLGEPSNNNFIDEAEENSMIDVDVFQSPSNEDVDRDDIVELRDDITN